MEIIKKERKQKTVTEKSLLADLNRSKHIEGINAEYYAYWVKNSGRPVATQTQYRSAINRLTQYLGTDKDLLTVEPQEIEEYLNESFQEGATKVNQGRFINAFLLYVITHNMSTAVTKCSNELLMDMIPSDYHVLMNILIAKGGK